MKAMKSIVISLLLIIIAIAVPVAVADTYQSAPTAHTTDLTFTSGSATNAYDGNTTSYAEWTCASGGTYLDVHTFSTAGAPTGLSISSVDFKMHYFQQGVGKCQYRISYKVDPSSTIVVLRDWIAIDHALGTDVWFNQLEPNDSSWSWSDITKIHFIVETRPMGGGAARAFREHEAWVTVNYTTGGGGVPEFPLGYAVELALIPIVLYMLLKAKGTSTKSSRLARS